jgi:hypothetical protein
MDRFEVAALTLVPGERVRIRATSHERWGVMVEVNGHDVNGQDEVVLARLP